MKFNYFLPLVWLIPVILIQLIVIPIIRLDSIVPDLILILLAYYGLKNGQLWGVIAGAVFGLLFDLVSGNLPGSSMFSKTLAGFVIGYFSNEQKIDNYFRSFTFSLIVLLASFIDTLSFTVISNFELKNNLLSILFRQSLLPALYTTVFSLFVPMIYPKRRFS